MSDWLLAASAALAFMIAPDVAVGASIGSLFFLLASRSETSWRKAAMLLVGWFVGYFTAAPLLDTGWGALIAILTSAFAVVIMLQVFASIEDPSKGTPKIFDWAVDVYNKFRGR